MTYDTINQFLAKLPDHIELEMWGMPANECEIEECNLEVEDTPYQTAKGLIDAFKAQGEDAIAAKLEKINEKDTLLDMETPEELVQHLVENDKIFNFDDDADTIINTTTKCKTFTEQEALRLNHLLWADSFKTKCFNLWSKQDELKK